jgi:hypothetical protein
MGIGIGYDFSKRFWSDLTLSRGCEYIEDADYYSENYVGDKNPFRRYAEVSVSLSANFNMIAKECYDIYLGIGGLYDTEYLFFKLPVGVRIRPFNNLKNIAFQVELQPAIDNDSYAFLFTRLGVHYSF